MCNKRTKYFHKFPAVCTGYASNASCNCMCHICAECRHVTKTSNCLTASFRKMCFCTVLYYPEVMFFCNFHYFWHFAWQTKSMDRYNTFCMWCNMFFNFTRIHIICIRFHIHKLYFKPCMQAGIRGCDKCNCRTEHFCIPIPVISFF